MPLVPVDDGCVVIESFVAEAGAAMTFTPAEPDVPPACAVIVAVPTAMPRTEPVELTVAIDVLLDVHVIGSPVTVLPDQLRIVAAACVVPPTATEATETDIVDTPAVTEIVADPDCPSLVAVMVALPGPTAVTTPAEDTFATPLLLVFQATARSVSWFEFASSTTAVA